MRSTLPAKVRGLRLVLNPPHYDWASISDLMDSVGMRQRKLCQLRRAVRASSDVVVAYLGNQLVGFGRMISDCTYYGTIWDVAVRVRSQGQGIGTCIMRRLLQRARQRKLYMLGLFTAAHSRAFYERLGFTFFDDVHAMTSLSGEAPAERPGKGGPKDESAQHPRGDRGRRVQRGAGGRDGGDGTD